MTNCLFSLQRTIDAVIFLCFSYFLYRERESYLAVIEDYWTLGGETCAEKLLVFCSEYIHHGSRSII